MNAKCPLCKAPALVREDVSRRVFSIGCVRCGSFRADYYAHLELKRAEWSVAQIGTASGYILRNSGLFLAGNEEARRLGNLAPVSPEEKANRLLLAVAKECPKPGSSVAAEPSVIQTTLAKLKKYDSEAEYPDNLLEAMELKALRWLSVASAADEFEFRWLIEDALEGVGFVKKGNFFSYEGTAYRYVGLTPAGWREVGRLQEFNAGSRIGFVAMSFLPSFHPLFDLGIMPGIRAAGYEAERVDRTEFNNRVDDEIIARIKRSRFLVADLTKQRGGIYFEAGYAMGLGMPVIWLVRENALKKVHFDTRQFNFVTWQEGEWSALESRLRFRIERTIGRGPLTPPDESG